MDDYDLVAVIRCFYVTDKPLNVADKWHWLTAQDQKQVTETEWKQKMKAEPTDTVCVSGEVTLLSNRDLTLPNERLVSRRIHCPPEHGNPTPDKVVTDTWVNEAGHWRWRQDHAVKP